MREAQPSTRPSTSKGSPAHRPSQRRYERRRHTPCLSGSPLGLLRRGSLSLRLLCSGLLGTRLLGSRLLCTRLLRTGLLCLGLLCFGVPCFGITAALPAQQHLTPPQPATADANSTGTAALPDAPSVASTGRIASSTGRIRKYIGPGTSVPPLTAGEKVQLALRQLYSPRSLLDIAVAAGYSHLTDGQPNYGTNSTAFQKRLGAAAIRDSSQGLLTDGVLAPLLHQDPRYYELGPGYSVWHRTLYALTRPLITRNDDGRPAPNVSLLAGYAGAAALTDAYYPHSDRNAADAARTWGTSLGGSALGFAFDEFVLPVLVRKHDRLLP